MTWPPDWVLALAAIPLAFVLFVVLFVAAMTWLSRPTCRFLLALRYRIKVVGLEHLPATGPVLLASNHMTWIDGFILKAACRRRTLFLVNADYFKLRILRWLARQGGLIPVPASGPHAQKTAIRAAQEALDHGEVVGILPEGQLSRNGLTGPFLRGLEVIVGKREQVAVVPVFLDNLWGSVFSFAGGRTLGKWPRGLRRTVGVAFGPPVPRPITAFAVRQAVLEAGVRAFALRDRVCPPPETLDPALPHLDHPELGPLAASTADFDRGGIRQLGQKPGTLGQAVPGIALRVVGDAGSPLPPDAEGRLQVLRPGQDGWAETGLQASIDRDGFVRGLDDRPAP